MGSNPARKIGKKNTPDWVDPTGSPKSAHSCTGGKISLTRGPGEYERVIGGTRMVSFLTLSGC
jgi:hypothetical protein